MMGQSSLHMVPSARYSHQQLQIKTHIPYIENFCVGLIFAEFATFPKLSKIDKLKMSQPIRGQGGHLVFAIGPKNTNLLESFMILLLVKFRWISFSCFREEVENVSANQRRGWPSCFSDWPEKKHKLFFSFYFTIDIKTHNTYNTLYNKHNVDIHVT